MQSSSTAKTFVVEKCIFCFVSLSTKLVQHRDTQTQISKPNKNTIKWKWKFSLLCMPKLSPNTFIFDKIISIASTFFY